MKTIPIWAILVMASIIAGCSADEKTPPTELQISSSSPVMTENIRVDKSTPENTVTGYYTALSGRNMDEWCNCWYEADECFRDNEHFEEQTKDVIIIYSDINAKTIYSSGVEALIEVSFNYYRESPSFKYNRDITEIFELEKFGDEWLMWGIEEKIEDTEYYIEKAVKQEMYDVQFAINDLMYYADPPIDNLDSDDRIASYVNDPSNPTNNMTDGGLITFSTGDSNYSNLVCQFAAFLSYENTKQYYIIDPEGNVRAFYDEDGEREVE